MHTLENQLFHDSRKAKYREPLGAVPAGSTVKLRLYAGAAEGIQGVNLALYGDGYTAEFPMECRDGWWQTEIQLPERAGAYWYNFVVFWREDRLYYGCKSGLSSGLGLLYSSKPLSYQLTCYDPSFETPAFFKKGILYQIFPDRYCKGNPENLKQGIRYHESMGRKAYAHGSFEESPMYLPLPGEEYYSPCDYFGGDLLGIEQSLGELAELGVSVLYLNPIFEADSNHRYNTSDYRKIDPMLGTEADFSRLCRAAKRYGIRIILDGVFSHTGSDSVYFNKRGNYPEPGAYQSQDSPYYNWYRFSNYPEEYDCWWGFKTLPEVNEMDPGWQEFVIRGENSVMRHWLRAGAEGYRLDVADELPDEVIEQMREAIKKEKPDALLLGEVWEDATTKESYGKRRSYAYGKGLDSVMNYPFKNAVVSFLLQHSSARDCAHFLENQAQNYPKPLLYCLMNLLSSHDIERIRTVLGVNANLDVLSREQQASFKILPEQDKRGGILTRLAAAIQFAIPGMPSIYYGDEVGMNGLKDPFNRAPYAVHDQTLIYFYKTLAKIRNGADAMQTGHVGYFTVGNDVLGVFRFILDGKDAFGNPAENGAYVILINRARENQRFILDLYRVANCVESRQLENIRQAGFKEGICLLTGSRSSVQDGLMDVDIFGESAMVFRLLF